MSDERRRAMRQDMRWKGLIIDNAGAIVSQCMMVNVSATGAKLVFVDATEVPDRFADVLKHSRKRQPMTIRRSFSSDGFHATLQSTRSRWADRMS
jgi:hypothetical protein